VRIIEECSNIQGCN